MGRGETQKELEDVYTGLAEVFLVVLIVRVLDQLQLFFTGTIAPSVEPDQAIIMFDAEGEEPAEHSFDRAQDPDDKGEDQEEHLPLLKPIP